MFSRVFADRLLINLDLVRPRFTGPMCDYLFVGHNAHDRRLWVVAVELKAGRPNSSEVVPQLSGGARYAEELLGRDHGAEFFPVVVFRGQLAKIEAKRFQKGHVRFFGKEFPIKMGRHRMCFPA